MIIKLCGWSILLSHHITNQLTHFPIWFGIFELVRKLRNSPFKLILNHTKQVSNHIASPFLFSMHLWYIHTVSFYRKKGSLFSETTDSSAFYNNAPLQVPSCSLDSWWVLSLAVGSPENRLLFFLFFFTSPAGEVRSLSNSLTFNVARNKQATCNWSN